MLLLPRLRSAATLATAAAFALGLSALVACGGDDADPEGASSGAPSCQSSSANSGGLCQLNFVCDQATGDGPAAYCTAATGACDCFASDGQRTGKSFTLAGVCEKERPELAEIVNRECGFDL